MLCLRYGKWLKVKKIKYIQEDNTMDIKKNKNKIEELIDVFVNKDEESFHKVAQEYINQISFNIGEAISPLNDLAVPFVVFALQEYIDTLKKGKEEFIDTIVRSISEASETGVVTVPTVRSIRNDG
jgi:acyl-CoA hydrolase